MDRALETVGAGPAHHFLCFGRRLDAAKTDLAQHTDTGSGEVTKILFGHLLLDDRRSRDDLYTTGAEGREGTLPGTRPRVEPHNIWGGPRKMDSPGGLQGRAPAMPKAVEPADLALARRPVA